MMKTTFRASAKTVIRKISSPVVLITAVASIVALGSLVSWVVYSQSSNERVFWGMVENNLKARTFTTRIVQDDGTQRSDQVVQAETSPRQVTHSASTLAYSGEGSAKIESESIGSPMADFLRYTSIETDQKSQSGAPLNFSDVLGVWGRSEDAASSQTNGQQYNSAVLGVLPAGSLNPSQRRELIKQMKDDGAYTIDSVEVTRSGLLRRPTYVMQIKVAPGAYIEALKSYAQAVGLTQLRGVDTSQYASASPVGIQLTIDGWSHQLRQVKYAGGQRIESFTGFNSMAALPALPGNSIPADELQARLQAIQ